MRNEIVAAMLVLLVPALCVHFSLLAYEEAVRRLGGRNLTYADWRNTKIMLPLLFFLLWVTGGYLAANLGESMLDRAVYQAQQCAYSAGRWQEARQAHPMRSVPTAFFLLLGVSQALLSALVARRYARDRVVSYTEVLVVWLTSSLVYWLVIGLEVHHVIQVHSLLSRYCLASTVELAT